MKKLGKIVMTGKPMPEADAWIRQRCEVMSWDEPGVMPRPLLLEWLADADGLMSVGGQPVKVDGELLAHAPKLRVIAQSSVGYDNVDVDACTARGIPFGNTPGVLTEATADLTYLLVLSAARRLKESVLIVQEGRWSPTQPIPLGVDLFGKTLGMVGLGQIGSAVARRAMASGMNVIYYNRRRRSLEEENGAIYVGFAELLAQADFIVVLVPLNDDSRGLFGAAEFAKMKKTALFINAARGAIVKTEELYAAVRDGEIAGCALDVTDPEPISADHPLLQLPNVFVTPHIGSATLETRNRMAMLAAENLILGLEKKPLKTCVNPSVNYR
jgi:glyoxylate reductase